jgi:hypothetical protein
MWSDWYTLALVAAWAALLLALPGPRYAPGMGIATFVRNIDSGQRDPRFGKVEQRLYRVIPPVTWQDHDEEGQLREHRADYVIVSASQVPRPFGGPETYIFPHSGKSGDDEPLSYGELPGSFKGALDHERALQGAGYKIAKAIPQGLDGNGDGEPPLAWGRRGAAVRATRAELRAAREAAEHAKAQAEAAWRQSSYAGYTRAQSQQAAERARELDEAASVLSAKYKALRSR